MSLVLSEDQEALRAEVRRFFASHAPAAGLHAVPGDGDASAGTWRRVCDELGLAGLGVPADRGGDGSTLTDAAVVLHESGYALYDGPLLSTLVAVHALVAADAPRDLIERLAAGTLPAALAASGDSGRHALDALDVRASDDELSGAAAFVIDAPRAELVLLPAATPAGAALFAVEAGARGVRVERQEALDGSRPLGRVALDRARGVPVGGPDADLQRVLDVAALLLAAEQVGVARRCLDMSVEYANHRVQFDRPIGSFQAIKHRCADTLLAIESAWSAVLQASAVTEPSAFGAASSVAKVCASAAATAAAKANIQIHGGIGFTWEHPAHLFLRRAKSSELLFGPPAAHRQRLAGTIGSPPASDSGPAESADDRAFRAELRAFLAARHPGKAPKDREERLTWARAWAATLADAGWAGPSWPRALGGLELPFARQVIYQEELARARVPAPPGTGLQIAAPTLIMYGTEEQKQRFLPPLLRGEKVWAQGYSEPDAGSDLPSLRTTARRDGDHYVVNGQKVWSTAADEADLLFTLVRTGTAESRQAGISYLLIDLHQPGVSVRPIRDLTGSSSFAAIFLDDVRVPVADRIGAENDGWRLARTSLGHERAAGSLNQAARYRRVVDELVALARERGLADDPLVLDALVGFDIGVRVMRAGAERTIQEIVARGEPGPGSSVSRLFITTFEQDLHEFAIDMLGPAGLLTREDPQAVQRARWLTGFLRTRASTIGAGTAEIQRNTIAERVLGLALDPAMPARG